MDRLKYGEDASIQFNSVIAYMRYMFYGLAHKTRAVSIQHARLFFVLEFNFFLIFENILDGTQILCHKMDITLSKCWVQLPPQVLRLGS